MSKTKTPKSDTELRRLRAVFDEHLLRWIANGEAGRYAVVAGPERVVFRDTFRDAWMASHLTFGGLRCLIREVNTADVVLRIGRAHA